MTALPAWLKAMPPLPLAPSVPVMVLPGDKEMKPGTSGIVLSAPFMQRDSCEVPVSTLSEVVEVYDQHREHAEVWATEPLRVNLNMPQGMRYAAAQLIQTADAASAYMHCLLFPQESLQDAWDPSAALLLRVWLGQSTDADRYRLASALTRALTLVTP